MLSIAAADQPCNSAGTISRRGFGRSGRLAIDRRGRDVLDLGCTRPDFCADDRSESGHVVRPARQPVDRALARRSPAGTTAHVRCCSATASITWTSSLTAATWLFANGLRILLVRGYDSLHHIKDDDLKLLSVRWSKGTDALDAALCSARRVFSDTEARLRPPRQETADDGVGAG